MDKVTFTFAEIRSALNGEWIGPFEPDDTVDALFSDTREAAANAMFFAFRGENFDAHLFLDKAVAQGAKLLCVEKGRFDKLPDGVPAVAVESVGTAYQALAHLHRTRFPAVRMLTLTGSCGKTSTKETVRAILNAAFGAEHVLATEGNTNNQIGVPRNLFRLNADHRAAIIEMGTNHPGEIEPLTRCAEPESAMIVSIGNCHLEFLGSLEGVAREKSHIFLTLNGKGRAAIPAGAAGFDIMKAAASAQGAEIVTFGSAPDCDFRSEYLGGTLKGASFRLTKKSTGESALIEWGIPGAHQANNAAGAAALADSLGIPFETIAKGIAGTTLPGMRMRVARHGESTWINDAYNANPDSMKASLGWLAEFADPAKLVLALGDMGELGDGSEAGHRSVLETAQSLLPGVRLVTVGPKMKAAAASLSVPPYKVFDSTAAAACGFAACVRDGDLVFLKASRSTGLEKLEPAETDR